MKNLLVSVSAGVIAIFSAQAALGADLPGKFDGVTIDAKLIGGQQYEPLYERIGEWEKLTGAKVNILSKKNHFELDKEIKSDIASGSLNWCVGSNHSSFAPQYPDIYTDLNKLLPAEEIAAFSARCKQLKAELERARAASAAVAVPATSTLSKKKLGAASRPRLRATVSPLRRRNP